jgi:glutathione S-transferase
VPVLIDGDFVLWESRAINAYLAALDPARRLYPDDLKARARVDQWSYWQAIHLGPSSQKLTFERVIKKRYGRGEPNEEVVAAESKETEKLLRVLDAGLGGRAWIAGDLSLADFALATTLTLRDEAGIDLGPVPQVAAWIERLEARDSWQQAVAPMRQPK